MSLLKEPATPEIVAADIVTAIGTRKRFDKRAIDEYAKAVADELPISLWLGRNGANVAKDFETMRDAVCKAEIAFQNLNNVILNSYDGNCLHTQTLSSISRDTGHNIAPKIICEYLARFKNNLFRLNPPKSSPGPNNKLALTAAQMLAVQYMLHFNELPSCGKGVEVGNRNTTKLKETPYDRICFVVTKHYGVKIPDSTRVKAINSVKEGELLQK